MSAKIVFMGTPEFAVPSLKALKEAGFELVITQPDKPAGRGKKLTPPPVKVEAERLGIKVYQPERIKDNEELRRILEEIKPELIVVAAYGKLLPEWLLNIPKKGAINVHASLLPKYRGASPIQAALLNGEEETGITIMKVSPELDAGDILSQESLKIDREDNAQTLHDKLSALGAKLLVETIPKYLRGEIEPKPQEHEKATYAPQIRKEMGKIDWQLPAERIFNMVRAFYPWPTAYTTFRGKLLKITKAEPIQESADGSFGEIVKVERDGFLVKTGDGLLKVKRVKPQGKREMEAEDFIRGYRPQSGERLGG